MQLGYSGGLVCTTSGTLGVLVKKPGGSDVFLLSCSHVIANCGQFNALFDLVPDSMKVVQQPLVVSCDAAVNRVGVLTKCFSKIVSQDEGDTTADIALALLDANVAASTSTINSIGAFASEDPSQWQAGMTTRLLGAVTSGAYGAIVGYDSDTPEYITYPTIGIVRFNGLVRYSTPCDSGDSGGAVIDDQNRLLGIHVAGDQSGQNLGFFLPVGTFMTQNGLVMA